MSTAIPPDQRISVPALKQMKSKGQLITMLTAYDATFAQLLDACGVEILLVGDSLGMVIQGGENTLSVTVEHIIYHTRAVLQGAKRAHVVADMPFMSYQGSDDEGIHNAGRLIKEGGAHAVKLEGGRRCAGLIGRVTEAGIPVMGHIGLTPQSVHAMGGYRVQGRRREASRRLVEDALVIQDAGAYSIVLEGLPLETARQITEAVTIPTIGIGAGPHCDGQVLVIYDLLGMNDGFAPKFVKRYENLAEQIRGAVGRYLEEVRHGKFPAEEHSFRRQKRERRGPDRPAASAKQPKRQRPVAEEVSQSEEHLAEAIPLYPGVKRR